jgi:hypothetical protein
MRWAPTALASLPSAAPHSPRAVERIAPADVKDFILSMDLNSTRGLAADGPLTGARPAGLIDALPLMQKQFGILCTIKVRRAHTGQTCQ